MSIEKKSLIKSRAVTKKAILASKPALGSKRQGPLGSKPNMGPLGSKPQLGPLGSKPQVGPLGSKL